MTTISTTKRSAVYFHQWSCQVKKYKSIWKMKHYFHHSNSSSYIMLHDMWIGILVLLIECSKASDTTDTLIQCDMLLESIRSCMVVLCGQTLLHRRIIANSLDKFSVYWMIHENHEIFSPWMICSIWYTFSSQVPTHPRLPVPILLVN